MLHSPTAAGLSCAFLTLPLARELSIDLEQSFNLFFCSGFHPHDIALRSVVGSRTKYSRNV